jgi:endoglucanase
MQIFHLAIGLVLSSLVSAAPSLGAKRAASILPLSTKGRDIIDSKGDVFHYKSTNWPGKHFMFEKI